MKRTYVILFLSLLAAPALVIGILAARWVRHEEQRLRLLAAGALQNQAAALAAHLDRAVRETADAVLRDFSLIPENDSRALLNWRDAHPFARNVFVWDPETLLRVPEPRWAAGEEASFIRRYEALFSGRRQWPADESVETAVTPLPKGKAVRPVASVKSATALPPKHSGWLAWFWERDVHLLGWIRDPDGGTVRGVELELLAVLSRLQPALDDNTWVASGVFALYDSHGAPFFYGTGYEQLSAVRPTVTVALGESLPHWQLRAVARDAVGGGSIAVLSGRLAAVLLLAILCGGGLLAWQGSRDFNDAMRKTTFVSNVSHELKTPLTTIRMYAELLRDNRVSDPAKRGSYLDVIAEESLRLTRLVNNVLDFSRLEQRRRSYRMEQVDLGALVRDTVSAQQERLRAEGLSVKIDPYAGRSPTVSSDRDALEQSLLNLLDNAAKYAADGKELSVTLRELGTHWEIAVADRGPGVAPRHRERIFESFYRVDDSLTARVRGTGLGLSIGRRLMRELGGDLVYRARDGGGSVFAMLIGKEGTHGQASHPGG